MQVNTCTASKKISVRLRCRQAGEERDGPLDQSEFAGVLFEEGEPFLLLFVELI